MLCINKFYLNELTLFPIPEHFTIHLKTPKYNISSGITLAKPATFYGNEITPSICVFTRCSLSSKIILIFFGNFIIYSPT